MWEIYRTLCYLVFADVFAGRILAKPAYHTLQIDTVLENQLYRLYYGFTYPLWPWPWLWLWPLVYSYICKTNSGNYPAIFATSL